MTTQSSSETSFNTGLADRVRELKGRTIQPSTDIMQTMMDTTSALLALQNVSDPFEQITAEICAIFGISHAVLMLVDPSNRDELVVKAEHVSIPTVSNRELALSSTVLHSVIDTGEAFYSADAQQDHHLATQENIIDLDLRAVAAVPLVGREGIIGVLYAAVMGDQQSLLTKSHFLPLLQTAANQAALILELAQQPKDRIRSLTHEELYAHGLGSYLSGMRRRLNLEAIDIEHRTNHVVDPAWLEHVEQGEPLDFDSAPHQNSAKLLMLANLFQISPDILFAIAGQPINLEVLLPEIHRWLPMILQEDDVFNLLHRLSQLPPSKRSQVVKLANLGCDWVMELQQLNKNLS